MKTYSRLLSLCATLITQFGLTSASRFTEVPSPNLDLSRLGRVAVVGDFDSISLYQYDGQSQSSYSSNGSQALLGQYYNGAFGNLAASDGNIQTMCPFVVKDGTLAGIVVGGNFTSLGGVKAQGIALFNSTSSEIMPLPGLSGRVSSLYCDNSSSTVYVGGAFSGGNSTNAIAWVTGWTNLPFTGFNGPVTSITKAPNGNIVFGGDFTGLGNATAPQQRNGQLVNIVSADVTAGGSTTTSGFTDPKSIVCKDFSQQGSGQTWLLADNTAGFWDAKFDFGFNPTMLRLYNTNYEGRGTATFSFIALPNGGIMNLTYTDNTGVRRYCDATCPLPQGNATRQDFELVNPIGMNEVRIDIQSWYGAGAGLNGIQLLEDDLYAFAVNDYNEPKCPGVSTLGANATSTGPWQVTPSGQSTSGYLTAHITSGNITQNSAQIVFQPDIMQSGNYSVTMYTPGCIPDNTCITRGSVMITGQLAADAPRAMSTVLSQSNNYDKYDQIYLGYVDVTSSNFRPTVTLTPMPGQMVPLTVVAQRVRFELISSNGGLNGLFEYNPNQATINTDFAASAINAAAMGVSADATINALAVVGDNLYVGGDFSDSTTAGINNIFSVGSDNATSLPNKGLNDAITTIYQNGSNLYIGGNFTNTGDNSVRGLAGVAMYSTSDSKWNALGSGVNGTVSSIVPLQINITSGQLRDAIAVSGEFTTVNAFGQNGSFPADSIAIWIPSSNNWLNNIQNTAFVLSGHLVAQTHVPNGDPLYAGSISSQLLGLTDGVALSGNGFPSLLSLGINVTSNTSAASGSSNGLATLSEAGVVTGIFVDHDNLNITAIGGSFSAQASDGSTINNFAIYSGSDNSKVTGLPSSINSNSSILSMDSTGTTLFIGGRISGTSGSNTVGGFLVYDLSTSALTPTQPPPLSGATAVVNTVAVQPNSANVFVGGNFTSAGSLSCPSLCMFDTSTSQWQIPATGISGVITAMTWASPTRLIVAGNLTVGGNSTTLAAYDSQSQTFSSFGGSSELPGPLTAMTPATSDYSQFWAAGQASNGSAYLQKFNGNTWMPVTGLGNDTVIRSLQVISLTENHPSTSLVDEDKVLLVAGNINLPNFGNASAALYNGTSFTPFLLANKNGNTQGAIGRMFVQNPGAFLTSSRKFLSHPYSLLIAVLIVLKVMV